MRSLTETKASYCKCISIDTYKEGQKESLIIIEESLCRRELSVVEEQNKL